MLKPTTPESPLTVERDSFRAWLLAIRPKTLSGAAVPVVVGAAMAVAHAGAAAVRWDAIALCLLFALLMQAEANLVNDFFDYRAGRDTHGERLGPRRAMAEGWLSASAMKQGMCWTALLAALTGLPLAYYGGPWMVAVGVACGVFCLLYTLCLAGMGLGDVLVVVFFGLVPVGCTFYVALPWDEQLVTRGVMAMALATGLVVDTLLVVNNYRDIAQDRLNHKRTLITLIGARAGLVLYGLLGLVATAVSWRVVGHGGAIVYPLVHLLTWRSMWRIGKGRELNKVLAATARNMLVWGVEVAVWMMV